MFVLDKVFHVRRAAKHLKSLSAPGVDLPSGQAGRLCQPHARLVWGGCRAGGRGAWPLSRGGRRQLCAQRGRWQLTRCAGAVAEQGRHPFLVGQPGAIVSGICNGLCSRRHAFRGSDSTLR